MIAFGCYEKRKLGILTQRIDIAFFQLRRLHVGGAVSIDSGLTGR